MAKEKKKKKEEIIPLPVLNGDGNNQLRELYGLWYGCARCPLFETRPNQDLVFGEGDAKARIMLIGEGPGEDEERTSIPFVGASGRLLNQMLAMVSDDPNIQSLSDNYGRVKHTKEVEKNFHDTVMDWRYKEFFITNVVCCRPPENRQPSNLEVDACSERLRAMINIVDPLVIVTVGKTALQAVLGKQAEITAKRGLLHEVSVVGRVGPVKYPVMPILHPSYLLRKADWKQKDGDFAKTVKDLHKAVRLKDELMLRHYGIPIPSRIEPQ